MTSPMTQDSSSIAPYAAYINVAMEMLPDPAFLVDDQFFIAAVNQRFLSATGLTDLAAVCGMKVGEALHCQNLEQAPKGCGSSERCEQCVVTQTLLRTLEKGERCQAEGMYKLGARIFDAEVVSNPTPLAGKVYVLTVIRDITERRQIERQRENALIRLQRSTRLAALGRLVAGISHELNNPLAIVLGNLLLLNDRIPAEDTVSQELVAKTRKAGQRIQDLVRSLRTFTDRSIGAVRTFQVDGVLERVLGMLRVDLCKHDIRVETQTDSPPARKGSESALEQSLLQVILNARDAVLSRPQNRLIMVSVHTGDAGGISITVNDNGCGIAPADLERVFEPFFTTKPPHEGSGLGLSISRELMVAQGGDLMVESELGVGTSVILMLPPPADAPE